MLKKLSHQAVPMLFLTVAFYSSVAYYVLPMWQNRPAAVQYREWDAALTRMEAATTREESEAIWWDEWPTLNDRWGGEDGFPPAFQPRLDAIRALWGQ